MAEVGGAETEARARSSSTSSNLKVPPPSVGMVPLNPPVLEGWMSINCVSKHEREEKERGERGERERVSN